MRPPRPLQALETLTLLLSALAPAACSDRCEAPPAETLARAEGLLSETGLYDDIRADHLAPGVVRYTPAFPLWSDGAEKRRFALIPAGARVDTSDMDFWQFPEGTRFWKEFTRDGVRVETRMLLKYGPAPSDWVGMGYAWRPDQSDAAAAPYGVIDAQGTPHDIPAAGDCFACHGGTPSRVLGFSAIQLSHDAPDEEIDLQGAIDREMLSAPPAAPLALPGDETERAALGYLHANCGHCHNKRRPTDDGLRCYDPKNRLDFLLRTDRLDAARDTPTYQTAIGFAVEPGSPDDSKMIDKVSKRPGMPPIATERIDPDAVALLRRWIAGMHP